VTVVLGSLTAVLTGCTTSDQPKAAAQPAKMSAAEVVAERQKFMKANGDMWRIIQDKTKAGDTAAVAAEADKLAKAAPKIPALFPPGSLEGKTAAKPEIWQKWPEFEAAAKNMETEAVKLRDTAKTNDKAKVEAAVKEFGGKACGTCHRPFRVPPPPAPSKSLSFTAVCRGAPRVPRGAPSHPGGLGGAPRAPHPVRLRAPHRPWRPEPTPRPSSTGCWPATVWPSPD
jgi:cytochrome c556